MKHVCKLHPDVEAHLRKLEKRLGLLEIPVHAYIAGGTAVHYYTGRGMSHNVDILWSHRIAIPPDMQVFEVANPDDVTDVRVVTMGVEFDDYQGSFHANWKCDAPEVLRIRNVVIHVISALDLAVSRIGRYHAHDRADVEALARLKLISPQEFEARVAEAINLYVGDTGFIRAHQKDALRLIAAFENGDEKDGKT